MGSGKLIAFLRKEKRSAEWIESKQEKILEGSFTIQEKKWSGLKWENLRARGVLHSNVCRRMYEFMRHRTTLFELWIKHFSRKLILFNREPLSYAVLCSAGDFSLLGIIWPNKRIASICGSLPVPSAWPRAKPLGWKRKMWGHAREIDNFKMASPKRVETEWARMCGNGPLSTTTGKISLNFLLNHGFSPNIRRNQCLIVILFSC